MFASLLNKRSRQAVNRGDAVYASIVAAARRPALYRDLGAPDTLPGRFEVIVLFTTLTLRRVRRGDADVSVDTKALGQEIFDAMFRALDANVREIGVGDISVPKRIKAMARSFYDGAKTYDVALDAGDQAMLASAIDRIILLGTSPEAARGIARYAMRAEIALAAQSLGSLVADGPAFPVVEEKTS